MTVWQRLMASGDTLLKDGLNDDSFYVSEKHSSAALSGMCLTTLIHSCDLGDEFNYWFFFFFPLNRLPQFNHWLGHQKEKALLVHPDAGFYIDFTACFGLANSLVNSIEIFFLTIWNITWKIKRYVSFLSTLISRHSNLTEVLTFDLCIWAHVYTDNTEMTCINPFPAE